MLVYRSVTTPGCQQLLFQAWDSKPNKKHTTKDEMILEVTGILGGGVDSE